MSEKDSLHKSYLTVFIAVVFICDKTKYLYNFASTAINTVKSKIGKYGT